MPKFNEYPFITDTGKDDTMLTWQASSGTVKQIKASSLRLVKKVPNLAALKSLYVGLVADGDIVWAGGYNSLGDNGGGMYYYNATSTVPDNGTSVLAPNYGAGRWLIDGYAIVGTENQVEVERGNGIIGNPIISLAPALKDINSIEAEPSTSFTLTSKAADGLIRLGYVGGNIDLLFDSYDAIITARVNSGQNMTLAASGHLDFATYPSGSIVHWMRLNQAGGLFVGDVGSYAGNEPGQGDVRILGRFISPAAPPTHNTSTGVRGTYAWDEFYIYQCIGTNLWARIALDATPW